MRSIPVRLKGADCITVANGLSLPYHRADTIIASAALESSPEAWMAGIYATLRTDLEMRPESQAGDSPVIVKDPVSRSFYRFSHVQAAVLRQMDGSRDSATIAHAASAECKTTVLPAQVEEFTRNLQKLLLLDHPATLPQAEAAGRPRNRFPANLLSIKIRSFNPDGLLTRFERKLSFFFRPGFHLFACCTVAFAGAIVVANYEDLFLSMSSLLSLYALPLILAVAFAVMTIHEFGHALAIKHFGGRVQQMGLMILYFIPALYCNLDDAWLMPRRQRLVVSLAGGYIQIVVCALATIAWRLLAAETPASSVLVVVIAFSAVQTLFNFNPLIRLDGYYLLSDLLQIPNLRPRAFAYLRNTLHQWAYGRSNSADRTPPREKWIYAVYGTAAFLFTAGILWILFTRVAGWMMSEFQAWGILAMSAAGLMSMQPGKKRGDDPAAKNSPGLFARLRKARRPLIFAAVLGLASLLPWELKVTGDFLIVPNKKILVTPEVEGILKSIRVDEGQKVTKGEILATIENLELNNIYEETRGELASKRAVLDLLRAGTRGEEIDRAIRQVETRRAELSSVGKIEQEKAVLLDTVAKREAEVENSGKNFERTRNLYNQGLIARADLERDETAYKVHQKELLEARGQLRILDERTDRSSQVRQKELEQAESELNLLRAGSRKESIRSGEADVRKLEEKLAILSRQIEQLFIKCPMDGIVTTPYLRNRLGEYLARGNAFCEIVSAGSVFVDLPVPEKEIADVQIGYPITLKVRGYPARSFEARVKSISPVAIEKGIERKVIIRGELENADDSLKAGMTGVGKILCGKRMIFNLATRRSIRWLRTEFWEYLP